MDALHWLRQLGRRVLMLLRGRRFDADLGEEMRLHRELREREQIERGLSPKEAHYAVQRRFGNDLVLREESRDMWGWNWIEDTLQDVRYGLRQLRRSPGFTAVAVLTLALGIGANSTVFSIVSAVLLRDPPVSDPQRLVTVTGVHHNGWKYAPVSAPDFIAWREATTVFEGMATAEPHSDMDLAENGAPERVSGMKVSANFFQVLGISAALGRTFLSGEDQPRQSNVVVLSDALWRGRFAGDRRVLGRPMRIDGRDYIIVGVMPAHFKLWLFPGDLWIPLVFGSENLAPAERRSRGLYVFARLKPGISVRQADAQIAAVAARLASDYPEDKDWGASVATLHQYISEVVGVGRAMTILMTAVGLVLVIACANIAGLLLARAGARRHEIGIRTALGASRWRLVRQLLSESLVLAVLGGAFGLALAHWGIRLLHSLLSFSELMGAMPLEVDSHVLAFSVAISVVAVLFFGLLPAITVSGVDPQDALRRDRRTGVGGPRSRTRRALVCCEIALAFVLLTAAGALIKALVAAFSGNFGFEPNGLLTVHVALPKARYKDAGKQATFFDQALERVQALADVNSAALVNGLPVAYPMSVPFVVEGQPPQPESNRPRASYYAISSGYLETLHIPLLEGRGFRASDRRGTSPVVLINQTLARRFFPGQDPVGRYVTVYWRPFDWTSGDTLVDAPYSPVLCQVVGVVGDVKDGFDERDYNAQIYMPFMQAPSLAMIVLVRPRSRSAALAAEIGRAIWSVDSDQVVLSGMGSLMAIIDKLGAGGDKLMCTLMAVFAALALLLAGVGIYGVIANSVVQRTQEIGLRMALGAQREEILKLIFRDAATMAGAGMGIGIVAALPVPHVLASALFNEFLHGATSVLALVGLVVAAAVLLACYIPARRATKVDPMVALRYE